MACLSVDKMMSPVNSGDNHPWGAESVVTNINMTTSLVTSQLTGVPDSFSNELRLPTFKLKTLDILTRDTLFAGSSF